MMDPVKVDDLVAVVRQCRALGIAPMLTGLDHDWDLIRVMLDAFEQHGRLPSLFEGQHYRIVAGQLVGPIPGKALAFTTVPFAPPNTDLNGQLTIRHFDGGATRGRGCVLTGIAVRWEGHLTLRLHGFTLNGRWNLLPSPDDALLHGMPLPSSGGGAVDFLQPFQVNTRYGESRVIVNLRGDAAAAPVPVTISLLGHTFAYAEGDHGPDQEGYFLEPEWIGHFGRRRPAGTTDLLDWDDLVRQQRDRDGPP